MAAVNGQPDNMENSAPKIIFYTNHACPWAHRAAITLKELGLPYEEVIIPLDRPRDEWYLKINPRGLVPAIKIDNGVLEGEIVTESATVSTFLADAFPKTSFYPASHEGPKSALQRARMGFFVDTFANKVNSFTYRLIQAEGDEKEELAEKMVTAIQNEIEPLLSDKGPFFGGSGTMTLADALVAPFVIRSKTCSDHGLYPSAVTKGLDTLPRYNRWAKAICAQESVTYVFDPPSIVEGMMKRMAKMKADGKKL